MRSASLTMWWLLVTAWSLHIIDARDTEKFYMLKNLLHALDQSKPDRHYLSTFEDLEDDLGWPDEMTKRAPPSGFNPMRGKRLNSDDSYYQVKRFPAKNEFFGARGKKDMGKRLPSMNDFFGARGKKSGWEEMKRYPSEMEFQPVRGKKDMGGNKRMPKPGEFFGARGKKNDKRIPLPNEFFGARGKKSSYEDRIEEKRLMANNFFGARGKKDTSSNIGASKSDLNPIMELIPESDYYNANDVDALKDHLFDLAEELADGGDLDQSVIKDRYLTI